MSDFLRLLLGVLVRLALLACILVGAAFIPAVQTWAAQWELARHPAAHATLASFWGGFGRVRAVDLRVSTRAGELSVPEVEARLPLLAGWAGRRARIRQLTARGWTFTVRGPVGADMESASLQGAAAALAVALDRLRLPADLDELDGVALEGDVVFPLVAGEARTVHLKVGGGGLAAGRPGVFTVSATGLKGNYDPPAVLFGVQGRVEVAMDTPRTISRVAFSSGLPASARFAIPGATVEAAAARGPAGETYSLRLERAGRTLARLAGGYSPAERRLEGDWTIDLADRDTSWLAASALAPPFAARGSGRFSANPFTREGEASGQLHAAATRPVPALPAVGLLRLDATFDAALDASSLRVRRLDARIEGGACSASVQALRPFAYDRAAAGLKAADAAADWLRVSLRGLPLAWLPARWNGYSLDAGVLEGDFTLRGNQDGFALRSQAPLAARGVSLSRNGRTVARGLDLTAALEAESSPDQWKVRAAPLAIARAGRPLATADATLTRPAGEGGALAITANWKAELPALAAAGLLPPWLRGRAASGECAASLGEPLAIEAKVAWTGLDPQDTFSCDLETKGDPAGTMSISGPVKIATGAKATDLAVDGAWIQDDEGRSVRLRLTGKSAYAEHLEAALALVTAAAGGSLPQFAGAPAGRRDAAPFWGSASGGIAAEFETLQVGGRQFTGVAGELQFGRGAMRLAHARLVWPQHGKPRVARGEAALAFDAAAPEPYRLTGSGTLDEIEIAPLFGPARFGHGPAAEGRFAASATLSGSGANLPGLLRNTRAQFELTSTTAILRMLGTDVAERIPQSDKTTVGERAGAVGSAVGQFFGMERQDLPKSQRNVLARNTDAVLLLNSQLSELGFDRAKATVVLAPGGAVRLTRLEMVAPDIRLTGTGGIAADPGVPLRDRPLSAELQLGVRGSFATIASQAGLPAGPEDRGGYAVLRDPIRLAGTLAHVDASGWSRTLLQAALPKAAAKK
ncbi:MAG TPA: hypothetical protein VHC86_14550 [Opitutaceae bacterium]|nr:hypothetical protein [Opitutaceae bacterium]